MNDCLVLRIAPRVFDVFFGRQWGFVDTNPEGGLGTSNSWARLKSGRNGVYVSKGMSLPHAVTKQLAASINPREEKQFVQLP